MQYKVYCHPSAPQKMKITIKLVLLGLLILAFPKTAYASDWNIRNPISLNNDKREVKLKTYLEKQKSPLLPYVNSLIRISDKYELRYSFIPAIASLESSSCKKIPFNSYNCYGWGPGIKFESFEDGFEKVAAGIKEKYVDKWGKDTVDKIAPIYAASPTWASRIKNFIYQIENTSIPEYHQLEPNL